MPELKPPLDPGFEPPVLFNRRYLAAAKAAGRPLPLVLGLEREGGRLSRYETIVQAGEGAETLRYVERLVKFLLWARGGWKIYVGGPTRIGEHIRQCYSSTGARAFDVELMGRAYERPFEVLITDADSVPPENEATAVVGGHWDGCRIGFDLGASDYKISAVKEGE